MVASVLMRAMRRRGPPQASQTLDESESLAHSLQRDASMTSDRAEDVRLYQVLEGQELGFGRELDECFRSMAVRIDSAVHPRLERGMRQAQVVRRLHGRVPRKVTGSFPPYVSITGPTIPRVREGGSSEYCRGGSLTPCPSRS